MKYLVLILAIALVAVAFVSPADAQCQAGPQGCRALSNNVQTPQAPLPVPAPTASATATAGGGFVQTPMMRANPFDDQGNLVDGGSDTQLCACPTSALAGRATRSRSVAVTRSSNVGARRAAVRQARASAPAVSRTRSVATATSFN